VRNIIVLMCPPGCQRSFPGYSVTDDSCNYAWSSSHCQYDPSHDVKCRRQTTARTVCSWPMTSAVSRHVMRAPAAQVDYRNSLIHTAGLYSAAADLKTFSDPSRTTTATMVSTVPSVENHIQGAH